MTPRAAHIKQLTKELKKVKKKRKKEKKRALELLGPDSADDDNVTATAIIPLRQKGHLTLQKGLLVATKDAAQAAVSASVLFPLAHVHSCTFHAERCSSYA